MHILKLLAAPNVSLMNDQESLDHLDKFKQQEKERKPRDHWSGVLDNCISCILRLCGFFLKS